MNTVILICPDCGGRMVHWVGNDAVICNCGGVHDPDHCELYVDVSEGNHD